MIRVGVKSKFLKKLPKLKYTQNKQLDSFNDELLTVKFRYKLPKGTKSIELVKTVKNEVLAPTNDMNFISVVALFGMQLSKSKFKNKAKVEDILSLIEGEIGEDKDGYKAEFVRLVKTYN